MVSEGITRFDFSLVCFPKRCQIYSALGRFPNNEEIVDLGFDRGLGNAGNGSGP
jgi:hypothetical protein